MSQMKRIFGTSPFYMLSRRFCSEAKEQPTGWKMLNFSSRFLDKFTLVGTCPLDHAALVNSVSKLRDELLTVRDNKERFYSILDETGQWLYGSYREGAGVLELMDQLHPHHHLALQVLDWRRKEVSSCVPVTSKEYAKGIKIAGRARDINLALNLFNEAAKKRIRTTSVYNALMGAYMVNGLAEDCQSLFRDFRKQGQCSPSIVTFNILISVYGRLLMVNNMEAAFEELCELKLSPTISTFNNLVAGYVTAWEWEKMESTFRLMEKYKIEPNIDTNMIMLRGFANSGNIDRMEEMYDTIKDEIGDHRAYMITAMICAYCKSNVKDRVKKIENLMGLISEEEYIPWLNVRLIQLYAEEDMIESMENRINEAFKQNTRVNTTRTMRAITRCYCRANAVDNLASFVKRAQSAGWNLCVAHYHAMIFLYGSQMRYEEMEGVISEMRNFHYGVVKRAWSIMCNLYLRHGMDSRADQVVGKMLKYGYLPPPSYPNLA